MRRFARLLLAPLLVSLQLFVLPTSPVHALGGPVILGGDDLTDHGSFGGGVPQQGWLYIQRALQNIKPNVTRANDNSVAALGSSPSGATCCDAGAAIGRAAVPAGLTVDYRNGAAAIESFFTALRAGTAKPAIIWISGTGAANNLDDPEGLALVNNATTIADFVSTGGGLLAHGSDYRWLSALLPGSLAPFSGNSGDLVLTPAGVSAFPGVTNTDINAGPWHNHFDGNLGGLQVLAKSTTRNDSAGNDAAVIIGGAVVTITPGGCPTVTPTITGTAGPDKLLGTPGPDIIDGLGGNDEISGQGGDDVILGGAGDDSLSGTEGNDTLCGGAGNDKLAGGPGDDKLFGGDGNDMLAGAAGDDTQSGEAGNDQLHGGPGTNTNDGGSDADSCLSPAPGTNCSP